MYSYACAVVRKLWQFRDTFKFILPVENYNISGRITASSTIRHFRGALFSDKLSKTWQKSREIKNQASNFKVDLESLHTQKLSMETDKVAEKCFETKE